MINFFLPAGFTFLRRSGWQFILPIFFLISLNGCAGNLNTAADQFHSGQPQKALQTLDKGDNYSNRNQLLFLLEKGIVFHQLGNYHDSIVALRGAVELIKKYELISLGEQTGSLVTSEWLTRYRGEYSERLWVHSYLMMNYLILGQYDDALVEAKQALDRLGDHGNVLQDDYFTRALIALCFTNLAEYNDAYLIYRKLAADLNPALVATDIVMAAQHLGMEDEVSKYQPFIADQLPAGESELVLFIANGKILKKRPGNVVLPKSFRFSFPYYSGRTNPPLQLKIEPRKWDYLPLLSTDLGKVAKSSLEARKVRIIAKETARVAAKEAIAKAVGNHNDAAAEVIVRIALFLLEEPDTRSWQTLPGRLTLVRIPLPAGKHQLQIELLDDRFDQRQVIELPVIELRRGQRQFHSLRF
ncbi:MAG: hypothetical protein KAU22_12370 [Desulfuromonadales bacterium]|nr:hypothetical protein [Desulfuromonadales bacterium]